MKKTAALLLVVALFILAGTWAYSEGISMSSENGDRVSLFDDIKADRTTNGNVITVLGNVDVSAKVNGEVVVVFGDVTVSGEVTGQVVTVFGNTKLTKDAVVHGNLITLGSVEKENGAKILGQEVRIFGEYMNIDIGSILYLRVVLLILFALAVLVLGLLILVVSRKKFEEIAKFIEYKTGKKLILGFLAYLGASILLVLLLITLVAPVLYIVLLILATLAASIYFGRLILRTITPSSSIYAEFITGLITITLIKLLLIYLVPQDDIILSFVLLGVFGVFINSLGLGILTEAKFGKK